MSNNIKRITIAILLLNVGILTTCSSVVTDKSNASNSSAKPTQTVSAKTEKANTETVAPKDEIVEIYDGRKDFELKDFSPSEAKPVQAEFDKQIELIKDKMGESFCNEISEVNINGIAKGSFTRPKSNQKAVLYDVCRSGTSHFGVGGLVIFENGKAVAHFVYGEHGLQSGLIYAPDVNKNGLNELVLIDYQMHQGNSGTAIILAEIEKGDLKFLGSAVTDSSNSGAAEDEKDILSQAYRISVQPSANPIFYRDSFEIQGNKKDWKEVKKGEEFSLNKEISKMYAEDFKSLEITQVN